MNGMTECRCGRRIPDTWKRCYECVKWAKEDRFYGGITDRLERYQMIRVKQKLNKFEVDPTWPEETKEAVLVGVANLAQEANLASFRKKLRAMQHIQVMWRNAQAHNLDVVDRERGLI